MKNFVIILGVVGIAVIAASVWLFATWQPEAGDVVSEERRQKCEEFLMVATFPAGPASDDFMKACLRGDPVLPEEAGELPPGLSENPPPGPFVAEGCAIGGCSQQICGEEGEVEDMVTTCEWRSEYACYNASRCEQQTDGQCGWTETPAFQQCLNDSVTPDDSEPTVY